MAFDPMKPLTFKLPDGKCNVMTYEYFEALMNEFLSPILISEQATGALLTRIENQIDIWLEQQQPEE